MSTRFIGRCDQLAAEDLAEFDDSSRDITNRTFRKYLGRETYEDFESSLGYGDWLRMSKDFCVSYAKGKWHGKPAICCFWSAYNHIFAVEP